MNDAGLYSGAREHSSVDAVHGLGSLTPAFHPPSLFGLRPGSTPGAGALVLRERQAVGLVVEFPGHEVHHQRPRQFGGVGMVPLGAGVDETVASEGKEMPLQRLPVGEEALPHPLLDGHGGYAVVDAVEDDGRALDVEGRVARVDRPDLRGGFVPNRRVVADEGPTSGVAATKWMAMRPPMQYPETATRVLSTSSREVR